MVNQKVAVILGASSGFGEAASLALAQAGFDIVGVHLDRRGTLPHVEEVVAGIEKFGRQAYFFNVNAADEAKRQEVLGVVQQKVAAVSVKVLIHSLAFGTLLPFVSDKGGDTVTKAQMEMTLDVMAHSLVYWTQDLIKRNLLGGGAKIFAMTSEGSSRVWATYGAVSAAKCALESHVRQLALELGKQGISVNAIRAGVTETPALKKIPGNEAMVTASLKRNPMGRLTTTQDVANVIVALSDEKTTWITGNVLGVDGGELIAS